MHKIFYSLIQYTHLDSRVIELEEKIDFQQIILIGSGIVIFLFLIIVLLQRRLIKAYKLSGAPKPSLRKLKKSLKAMSGKSVTTITKKFKIAPKDLPDPGLLFKYSLAKEHVKEKLIAIGQTEGNIKTYSTEITDDHLSISIRIIENMRDRDIYDLPDKIIEEYQLDIRRDGKVMIYHEGLENFTEMGSRQRIYLKGTPDEAGELTFPKIDPRQPVRFRLGDRLNMENKFIRGYFEFHLFTMDYPVKTKTGIDKIEKYIVLRLYKIYPGYDTSNPDADGFYPMIDPYTTGG